MAWKLVIILAFVTYLIAGVQFPLQQPPDPERGIFDKSLTPEQIANAIKQQSFQEREKIRETETNRLIQEPLDKTALRNITLLTILENGPKAEELAIESSKRSLRDPQNQLMAVQSLLKKDKFEDVLVRLDGLLRAKPYLANGLFPTILTVAKNPKATPAFTALLKTDPPWRRSFMKFVLNAPTGFQQAYQILSQLRAADEPLHVEELRATLKAAIGTKAYDAAYYIWLDFLDEAELRRVGPIYDGNFDLPSRNLYFDWTLLPQKNLNLLITKKPGSTNDKSLELDFFGYGGPFAHVSQMLRLSSGTYEANFETYGQNFKSEGGLQLQVRCADTGKQLGSSIVIRDSKTWTSLSFGFSVPPGNCETQLLRLESASKAKLDNLMSGKIYFDNFSITLKSSP